MATFRDTNKVRVGLKMKLSQYAWYVGSHVSSVEDGYGVVIVVTHINNEVRKQIPPVIDSISIKTEVE